MKCFTILIIALLTNFLSFSAIYGEDNASTLSMTFLNKTHTTVTIDIAESLNKKPPYSYVYLNKFTLAPREGNTFPVDLLKNTDPEKTIMIKTSGGKGYGKAGDYFLIDVNKSNNVVLEMYSEWVRVGEDFWPPVEDFQVVRVRRIE